MKGIGEGDLVKRSNLHLSGRNFICQVVSHCSRASMSCWSCKQSSLVVMGLKIKLSSANSLVEEVGDMDSGRSLIYSRKRSGPRTVPCGTPEETVTESEEAPSRRTRWVLFVRKAVIQ